MPQFFSNKRLILLLVGMIFLVALISFTLRDRNHASLPEQLVKDVVGFGQTLFSKPTQYVTGAFNNIDSLLNTYDENKRYCSSGGMILIPAFCSSRIVWARDFIVVILDWRTEVLIISKARRLTSSFSTINHVSNGFAFEF